MQQLHRFPKRVSLRHQAIAVLCLLVIFCVGATAWAQSGRRVAKRPTVSATPTTETKPATKPTVAKAEQPHLSLYVCMDQRSTFTNIPSYLSQTIRNVFIQRIEEASAIKVVSGVESNRAEAIKRAKSQDSAYVVLLQLESNGDSRSTSAGNPDYSSLYIHFAVFAPVTGKTQLESSVYQEQYRVGRGGVGLPSRRGNNSLYADYLLKDAARAAADRVVESLRSQVPRDPGTRGN